jgi:Lipid desaturase domain
LRQTEAQKSRRAAGALFSDSDGKPSELTHASATAKVIDYFFGGGARHPSRYRFIEVLALVAYGWVSWLLAVAIFRGVVRNPLALWLIIPTALIAYLTADFLSGVVHWFADTYATASTPFFGPKFIRPFREHHTDPLAITRHDFIEANGDNALFSQTILLPIYGCVAIEDSELGVVAGFFALLFGIAIMLTSMAHGWAHMAEPPKLAQRLQRWGLILSPEHHAVHHVKPHQRHYCITTGWLNPLLDRTRFFRRLERALAAVGIRPGDDTALPPRGGSAAN